MSETVNQTLSAAEGIYKSLVWDSLFKAVATSNTWLMWPIISVAYLKVRDYTFGFFKLFIDVTAVKILDARAQKVYDEESIRLHIVWKEKGTNSDEYKKELQKSLTAMVPFTNFRG